MNHHRQCPIPTRGGRDCWETSHPDSKHGLCERHWREITQSRYAGADQLELRCASCGQFGMRTIPADNIAYCINRDCGTVRFDFDPELGSGRIQHTSLHNRLNAPEAPKPVKLKASVVYYIRWSDRIKIGTTTSLPQRMKALYFDEIMAIEPGGTGLEAQRHQQFAEYRLDTYREWFNAAPGLVFFANTLRDKYGSPMKAWRDLSRGAA